MLSEKARKHATACRYCWMCRHLCPVGLYTGKEVNTPRAKGLLLAMSERGYTFDADTAEVMYACTLCGACSNDCATGFEPPIFIREARTQAVVEGLAPAPVQEVINRLLESGNLFGVPAAQKFAALDVRGLPDTADVLLYVGDTAAVRQPGMANAVIHLLRKAGVSFTVLAEEPSAGTEMGDLIGFVEDVRAQAKRCVQAIQKTGAKTVVVVDPYDASTMKHQYPTWDCGLNAEVSTATAFVAALVRDGKLAPRSLGLTATYHDSARLARDLDEHQPARDLIAAMGITLKEMFLNRRMAKGCGSEVFKQYAPDLARGTAAGRWDDAKRTGATLLLTACPEALDVLLDATPEGYAVQDLFTLLDEACSA